MHEYINKKLPIGYSDFKMIIEENMYFVDKTYFINAIINTSGQAIVITRPRRFGKTLAMSMLYYFFHMHQADKHRKLFDKLAISKNKQAMQHQGTRPTIFISLKGASATNYDEFVSKASLLVSKLYQQHRYLLDSDRLYPEDKVVFQNALHRNFDSSFLSDSIQLLSTYLHRHFFTDDCDAKVYVIFDEYDAPLQNAYTCKKPYYDDLIAFSCVAFLMLVSKKIHISIRVLLPESHV